MKLKLFSIFIFLILCLSFLSAMPTEGETLAPCAKPTAFKVTATDGSAIFGWQIAAGDSVIITVAGLDTAFKKAITVGGTAYTLSGLPKCKHFIAYIQTKCASGVSDYLEGVAFETAGCAPAVCSAVARIGVSVVDVNNTVMVQWSSTGATKYYVEYRLASDSLSGVWRRDSTTLNYKTLTGLQSCLSYAVRITAVCANGVTAPSAVAYIKTQGCSATTCHRPIAFKGAALDTVVYFAWATELNENNAVLKVISTDSVYQKIINVTGYNYTLTGLPRCKKFIAFIQTKCPTGVLSDALEFDFSTGGCTATCGTPAEMNVASVDSTHASLKWTNVGATKYYIEYKTDSSAVWKRDSSTTTTIVLKDLIRCRLYLARVSAVCANGVSTPSNIVRFITTGCVVPVICKTPAGLDADIVRDTTVTFMWTGADSLPYEIQYQSATDVGAPWNVIKTTHPNYVLTGLKRCQTYVWQVRSICGTTASAWSALNKFSTLGCGTGVPSATCPKIQEIVAKFIADTAVVYWASFSFSPSVSYQVSYRKAVDTTWTAPTNTTLPFAIFKNLSPCFAYVVRVRVQCDTAGRNFGDWSEIRFKTPGSNCLRGDNSGLMSSSQVQASVSPNPGTGNPTIVFVLQQPSPVRIDLVNLNGRVVGQWNAGTLQAGDYAHTFENVDILPPGLYIVSLRVDGNATQIIKWLKNE